MPANTIVKKSVTRVRELVAKYDIDIAKMPSNVRAECKNVVAGQFKTKLATKMQNANMYRLLRTYSKIKSSFDIAPYLDTVKNH